jgi:hypothetical protein
LFWLQFGLKTTDTVEGWVFLNAADEPGWTNGPSGRIMEALPWEIAALISPDSFAGAQIVLAALFFGKAFCLYRILQELRLVSYAPAFLIALLFVIYPADEGLFLLRGLTRHSSVFFYLLATLLLLLACQRRAHLYGLLMFLALAIAGSTDEAGFLLALATPLVLLLLPRGPTRGKLLTAGLWYLSLSLTVLRVLSGGAWYQAVRLRRGLDVGDFPRAVLLSTFKAYIWGFVDAWQVAVQNIDRNVLFLLPALALTLIAVSVMLWTARIGGLADGRAASSTRPLAVLFLAGVAIFGLAFLPYAVTDWRWVGWRVFYFPSIGAALALVAVILFVVRKLPAYGKAAFMILGAVLLFLASLNGFAQKADASRKSGRQQKALVSLIEQAPHLQPGTTLVLYSSATRLQPFAEDWIADRAIDWTYDPFVGRAVICYGDRTDCAFSASGFTSSDRRFVAGPSDEVPYDELLFFQYFWRRGYVLQREIPRDLLPGGSTVSNYDPYARISGYTPFPQRPQVAFEAEYAPVPARVAPRKWKGEQTTLDDRRVCDVAHEGRCSLHIAQGVGSIKRFGQEISFEGGSGEQLLLQVWTKRGEMRPHLQTPRAILQIMQADGTTAEYVLAMDGSSQTWTVYQLRLETPKAYTRLRLSLESGPETADVWFDSLSLMTGSLAIPIENTSFEE